MDAHASNIFLRELRTQALMSINAVNALRAISRKIQAVDRADSAAKEIMHAEHFRTIHSFLTHLSNTSRLIWPPSFFKKDCYCGKPKAEGRTCGHCLARDRAATIQQALEVVGVEHALKDRSLRDHLEHFDERLDAWQSTSERRNYVQDYIGPKGGILGLDESDMMRQFDPGSGDFTFRGESFSLIELEKGAADIVNRSEAALTRLGEHF